MISRTHQQHQRYRHRPILGGAFLLLGALASASPVRATEVEIWFATFIPSVADEANRHFRHVDGKTYIVDPLSSDTCYGTDNRSWSTDKSASARVKVRLVLQVDGRNLSIRQHNIEVGETHRYRCADVVETQNSPRRSGRECVSVSSVRETGRFLRTIGVSGRAPNPFFQIAGKPCSTLAVNVAARIDFDLVIRYNILTRSIEISGSTGTFPNFEGYYQVNGSLPQLFMKHAISPGSSPLDLIDAGLGVNTSNFEPATIYLAK